MELECLSLGLWGNPRLSTCRCRAKCHYIVLSAGLRHAKLLGGLSCSRQGGLGLVLQYVDPCSAMRTSCRCVFHGPSLGHGFGSVFGFCKLSHRCRETRRRKLSGSCMGMQSEVQEPVHVASRLSVSISALIILICVFGPSYLFPMGDCNELLCEGALALTPR